jgi:hypothetical protein
MIAAAVVVSVVVGAAAVAAAAEQQDQDDDPPAVVATVEAIVTHKNTSEKNFFERLHRSFHGILPGQKGAASF